MGRARERFLAAHGLPADLKARPLLDWNPSMPSRGLGDTIAKFTRATGIAKVVHAASRRLGRDCGCKGRQDRKNAEHPYHAGKIKVGFVSPALALGGVEEFLRLRVAGLSADDR